MEDGTGTVKENKLNTLSHKIMVTDRSSYYLCSFSAISQSVVDLIAYGYYIMPIQYDVNPNATNNNVS
jgi:hypothetical protein